MNTFYYPVRMITAEMVREYLTPQALVQKLKHAFASDITTPMRQHFDIPNPKSSRETTLLLMPSWQAGEDIGMKIVTVTPDSHKYQLPSIQGTYVLMDAVKGNLKAIIDAPALTAKRTAAASALASSLLSRPDCESLLMVGTGTLAPELIKAHCAVRPIKTVTLWGRSPNKAQALKAKILTESNLESVRINVATDLDTAVSEADIISCATLSIDPLIKGKWLQSGQHLDLVGAYRPDMREVDDDCLLNSKIVVDSYAGATKETGDIKIPLDNGIINLDDIKADLFQLCRGEKQFTRNADDITLFKSVGHALEDLAAAQLLLKQMEDSE